MVSGKFPALTLIIDLLLSVMNLRMRLKLVGSLQNLNLSESRLEFSSNELDELHKN